MKRQRKHLLLSLLALMIVMAGIMMRPSSVQAASLKNSKPAFTKDCAYLYDKVYLKWSAVTGAKQYQVQRALIDPSTGKIGKWKLWKTVKTNSLKVKTTGDYKYRVRAVSGKTVSKWSTAKRVFAARAVITKMGYTPPEIMFGVQLHEGMIELRAEITNKTKSEMGFVDSGSMFGAQHTLYAIGKTTGKAYKSWEAYLDTGSSSAIAKVVEPGKSQSIYIYAFVTAKEWAKYKNYRFMVTSSFYPNPYVEPVSTQMALSYRGYISKSSLAAK